MEHRQLLESITTELTDLYERIEETYAPSRERALAITKLDECLLWLGASEVKKDN